MGWDVYWLSVLDGVDTAFTVMASFNSAASLLTLFPYIAASINGETTTKTALGKVLKITIPAAILATALSALTPSTDTLVRAHAIHEKCEGGVRR